MYVTDNVSVLSTRRAFLGGAAAAGAAHTAAGPLLASGKPGRKICAPVPPGVATSAIAVAGATVWTADAAAGTITSHRGRKLARRRSIDVGGPPVDIAISPDGRRALVATSSRDASGLAVVDLRSGAVTRLDVGPEPCGVAFSPDGRSAFVTGGGAEGTLRRVVPASGTVGPALALGAHPRAIALLGDGGRALVALNGDSAVALVDLPGRRVLRRIRTAPFPRELAVSADGERALVTHNGFEERTVTLLAVTAPDERPGTPPIAHTPGRSSLGRGRRVEVGLDPGGAAFAPRGSTALVSATGSGSVVLLDARSGRKRRTIKLGGAPRAVALAANTAFVADAVSGAVKAIRVGSLR